MFTDVDAEALNCTLPSPEEQQQKQQHALQHLAAFVRRAGGELPDGWDCRMRFRVTNRRNGRLGRTTDNYYYSPCGRTFRTHKQVAEFLGLSLTAAITGSEQPSAPSQPASVSQPSSSATAQAARGSDSSNSCSSVDLVASTVPSEPTAPKQTAAAPAPSSSMCSLGSCSTQAPPAAAPAPAPAAPTSNSTASSRHAGSTTYTVRKVQQPAFKQPRTKASVAAKMLAAAAAAQQLHMQQAAAQQ